MTDAALAEHRRAIDAIDDRIVALLEARLAHAAALGEHKPSDAPLRLRPDREAAVLARMQDQATPAARPLVVALWREIMAAGLAAQQAITVVVGGSDPALAVAARSRFGASTRVVCSDAKDALDRAAADPAIAVLPLDGGGRWWTDLSRSPTLQVFDILCDDEPAPIAVALGRVEPSAMADGPAVLVGRPEAGDVVLAGCGDTTLLLRDGVDLRTDAVVGRVPALP